MTNQVLYVLFACFLAGAVAIAVLYVRLLFGKRDAFAVCSVALGEVGVKSRVKKTMSYKKPTLWVIAACLLLCAVVAVLFLTDPKSEETPSEVASDVTSEVTSDVTSGVTSDESVLEVTSEESSAEASSDESEPEESSESEESKVPEPVVPDERETTVELLKEFPLGENGIPYVLYSGENPSVKKLTFSSAYFADEKGNVYLRYGDEFITLFGDGEISVSDDLPSSWLRIHDEKLYILDYDNVLHVYHMQGEKIRTVTYPEEMPGGTTSVFVASDNTVHVLIDGKFFDEYGAEVSADYDLTREQLAPDTLKIGGKTYTFAKDLFVSTQANGILTAWEYSMYRTEHRYDNGGVGFDVFEQRIVYQFDRDGNPLSEFAIYHYTDHKGIACGIFSDGVECTSYHLMSVRVGEQLFDGLIEYYVFVGTDGTVYMMLIDPDGGKLYKINPGYSDVEYTDFEALDEKDEILSNWRMDSDR